MHLQLCNLEQTTLNVFRYGRLIRDKTLVTWREKTRIGRVSLTTARRRGLKSMLRATLERDGFEVIAVAGVVDALSAWRKKKLVAIIRRYAAGR
jgi:hypothetical protein